MFFKLLYKENPPSEVFEWWIVVGCLCNSFSEIVGSKTFVPLRSLIFRSARHLVFIVRHRRVTQHGAQSLRLEHLHNLL